jgi:hypothetical protein
MLERVADDSITQPQVQERVRFLTSIVPSLSVSATLQLLRLVLHGADLGQSLTVDGSRAAFQLILGGGEDVLRRCMLAMNRVLPGPLELDSLAMRQLELIVRVSLASNEDYVDQV